MLNRLYKHLHKHNNIHAGHNTDTAIFKVYIDILLNIKSKNVVILLFLDLSPAFDTVDHSILLDGKKYSFGKTDVVLERYKNYMTDTTQRISVCVTLSNDDKTEFKYF